MEEQAFRCRSDAREVLLSAMERDGRRHGQDTNTARRDATRSDSVLLGENGRESSEAWREKAKPLLVTLEDVLERALIGLRVEL